MQKFAHLNHRLRQPAETGKTTLIKLDWYLEALDEALKPRMCWSGTYVGFRLILWFLVSCRHQKCMKQSLCFSHLYLIWKLWRDSSACVFSEMIPIVWLRLIGTVYCVMSSYLFFLCNCKEILAFVCCLDPNTSDRFYFITREEGSLLKLIQS